MSLRIFENKDKLKEFVNDFKIPDKYFAIADSDSLNEEGSGLSELGSCLFLSFAIIPKDKSAKVFEKIKTGLLNLKDNGELDTEEMTILALYEQTEHDLVLAISTPDATIEHFDSVFKKYPNRIMVDEPSIEKDGLHDNDGQLMSMGYKLTLSLLLCQKFYTHNVPKTLTGKSFCFTGFRDKDAESEITKQGGKLNDALRVDTSFLISANIGSGSKKEEKAEELNIPVMSMFQLITEIL